MKPAQPILFVVGLLLMILAASMSVPAIVDIASDTVNPGTFPISAGVTFFIGGALFLSNSSDAFNLSRAQAFVMTTLIWLILPLFGSIPFMIGQTQLNFTDAYFEAMSGITTTGSTVITGLDTVSPGILLWRAMLQWIGGLGIIVMSISILPMLKVGGMQLFKIEAFETGEKFLPRATQISAGVTGVFVVLTAICAIALWFAGMNGLEAAIHAMTTIATGGFSTSDASVGHFNSASIDAIITAGMIVGGIPFLLILLSVRKRSSSLFEDPQVRYYLGFMLVSILAVSVWLWTKQGITPASAFRYSSFAVASIMTGTGFASSDYTQWGTFPVIFIFGLTFVGGCAGSTACGIKIFRFQILISTVRMEFRKLLDPHSVSIPYFGNRPISGEILSAVLGFFFLFMACFATLTMALAILGLDFTTAISSAATAMSNVGPGLGPIVGPSGTFESLPDMAKWLLAFGMLIGRLEVLTILTLFSRQIWRN